MDRDVIGWAKQALDSGLDGLSEIGKVIKKSSELIKKWQIYFRDRFDQKNKVITY